MDSNWIWSKLVGRPLEPPSRGHSISWVFKLSSQPLEMKGFCRDLLSLGSSRRDQVFGDCRGSRTESTCADRESALNVRPSSQGELVAAHRAQRGRATPMALTDLLELLASGPEADASEDYHGYRPTTSDSWIGPGLQHLHRRRCSGSYVSIRSGGPFRTISF